MRVLITGASGFIASKLIKKIQKSQRHKVIVSSSTIKSERTLYWEAKMSPKTFAKYLIGFDIVIHLASYIPTNHIKKSEVKKCIDINSIGTLNLLEACKLADVKKFVFISSANIFSPNIKEKKISETSIIDCNNSPYYLGSKVLAEIFVKSFHSKKLSTLIIRLSSIYGKNMKNGAIINIAKKLINKEKIILKDNGEHQADFLYIDDCVLAIEKLSFSKAEGEFNIGSGSAINIFNLTNKIANIHSIKDKKIFLLPSKNNNIKGFYPVDLTHLRSVMKFKPRNINDGLAQMFQNKKKNLK